MTTQRVQLQPAYLLHRRPFRDSSQLLELFSLDYGRVALVAKGVARRRRGGTLAALLQPFKPLLISFSSRGELGTLTGVEAGASAAPPPAGERLFSALYLNELLTRLLHRHDAHPMLFGAYGNALEGLRQPQQQAPVLRRFEFALLEDLGYALDLDRDVLSGAALRADRVYRIEPEQGISEAREVGEGDGRLFSGVELMAIARGDIDGVHARAARRLTRMLLAPHLGAEPLRSRALLSTARRASPAAPAP